MPASHYINWSAVQTAKLFVSSCWHAKVAQFSPDQGFMQDFLFGWGYVGGVDKYKKVGSVKLEV